MFYIPLTTNPLGWLLLGAGGYALYKTGKKRGKDQAAAARISPVSEPETPAKKKGETK